MLSRLIILAVAVFIAYPAFSRNNDDHGPNVPMDRSREVIIEKGSSR